MTKICNCKANPLTDGLPHDPSWCEEHNCILHGYKKGECNECRETDSAVMGISVESRPDKHIHLKVLGCVRCQKEETLKEVMKLIDECAVKVRSIKDFKEDKFISKYELKQKIEEMMSNE